MADGVRPIPVVRQYAREAPYEQAIYQAKDTGNRSPGGRSNYRGQTLVVLLLEAENAMSTGVGWFTAAGADKAATGLFNLLLAFSVELLLLFIALIQAV